jgi:hypothetical protein
MLIIQMKPEPLKSDIALSTEDYFCIDEGTPLIGVVACFGLNEPILLMLSTLVPSGLLLTALLA